MRTLLATPDPEPDPEPRRINVAATTTTFGWQSWHTTRWCGTRTDSISWPSTITVTNAHIREHRRNR